VKAGFVFASLYLVLAIVIGLPVFLIFLASPAGRFSSALVTGQVVGGFIGALVIYAILGFVIGGALALAYNLTVPWTGGLELLLETPPPPGPYQSPWAPAGPAATQWPGAATWQTPMQPPAQGPGAGWPEAPPVDQDRPVERPGPYPGPNQRRP
jgi:hypothetical protein